MIAKIIVASKPRIIIHTLEGHGWERIVAATAHALPNLRKSRDWLPARGTVSSDKSLYYDHGGGTVPDHIFTSGDITRDILSRDIKFFKKQITTLGSIKRDSLLTNACFQTHGTCLFAPEGTLDEVRIMTQLATNAARQTSSAVCNAFAPSDQAIRC